MQSKAVRKLKKFLLTFPGGRDAFAKKVGVSRASVYRWLSGGKPGSRALRVAVQTASDGKVAPPSWDVPVRKAKPRGRAARA